jgi:membrane-associated HD superfamily phosphohydrolase
MKTFKIISLLLLLPFVVFCQGKKDVKKNKIKTITVWQTDIANGESTSYKESYEEYDKNGNPTALIEYDKNGTVTKKETAKYDKFLNKIEETQFDLKDKINVKKIFKYNAKNEKIEEMEYNSSGKIIKRTTITYKLNGDKATETVYDASGELIKKIQYNYNAKHLRTERQTLNSKNVLKSLKKWSYEYH